MHFYPRPPRGGRPAVGQVLAAQWAISIHALREEGDAYSFFTMQRMMKFLSTPSARRATKYATAIRYGGRISIHALREEGDVTTLNYPRIIRKFLSTPSARRAT